MFEMPIYDGKGYNFVYHSYGDFSGHHIHAYNEDAVDSFWELLSIPLDCLKGGLHHKMKRIHWMIDNGIHFTVRCVVTDELIFKENPRHGSEADYIESMEYVVCIPRDEDAVLFKLTWGNAPLFPGFEN